MPIAGSILTAARKSRGRSQEEIAAAIGRKQAYVSKLERDDIAGGIKGDELLSLAEYLHYDPHVFSGDLSLEDGDLRGKDQEKVLTSLVREIEELKTRIRPAEERDPVAEKVAANQDLRDIARQLMFLDSIKLREISAVVFGWLQRDTGELSEREEKVG